MKKGILFMISVVCVISGIAIGIKYFSHKEASVVNIKREKQSDVEEKIVTIDGEDIYFKKIGAGKYPLLMIHGYGGSADGFKGLFPTLSKDFTVIAIDMIWFGRSSKPDIYPSFPKQANMYMRLMKKLGYEHFAVLGHSMGGQMALNIAYLYPKETSHLILVDATGVETLTNGTPSSKPNYDVTLKSVMNLRDFHGDKPNDKPPIMYLKKLRIAAKEMTLPTLLVWGRKDESVPWEQGKKYHSLLRNSEFCIIEEGNHAPFRQQAKEFLGYVEAFFKKNPVE